MNGMGMALSKGAMALSAAVVCGALRAGELRDLWYFAEQHYFADREQFVIATNIVDRAAKAGYTACACITGRDNFGNWRERVSRNDGSDYFVSNFAGVDAWWRLTPERQARFRAFAEACREKGVEFVPLMWSVGYGSANLDDPNRVAAWPSRSMPYAAKAGRAVAVHETVPVDFAPVMDWGSSTNAFRRMVVAAFKPFRRYRLSCEVKTEGMPSARSSQIMMLCDANHTLGHASLSMEPTQDWTPVDFGFNPGDQTSGMIRFACNAKSGRFAVRNLRLEAVGVEWPVRRAGCPLTVRDAATGRVYEEGRDYARVPGLDRITFNSPAKEMELELLPGGAIADGAQLLVDAYEPVFAMGVQASSCLVNPGLYEYFERSAAEIAREFGCRKWFLSLDEVRVECRCELCAKSGLSMGAKLADAIKRMRETIRRRKPDAELFMWSDMLDENHNAAPTKGWYYQCATPFAGGWEDVPRDIVMVPWWGKKCDTSLQWLSKRGFKTLGGAFYDRPTREAMCENLGRWTKSLLETPGSRGVMYTTWQNGRNCGNYRFLEAFADEFRRLCAAERAQACAGPEAAPGKNPIR